MGRDGGGTGRDGEGQINGCQQEMELRDDVFKIHIQDTLVPLDLSFSASCLCLFKYLWFCVFTLSMSSGLSRARGAISFPFSSRSTLPGQKENEGKVIVRRRKTKEL